MPVVQRTPSYRKHKRSGQAIVTLSGKMFYLGPWGSKTSKQEYDRVIAEWLNGGRQLAGSNAPDITIAELAIRYWKHSQTNYTGGELDCVKSMLAHTRRLYGGKPVVEFGPLALKSVRDSMVNAGWSRNYVNAQIKRVRRMIRWAADNELVPGEVWHTLQAVAGLRRGKTTARESVPVTPVADEIVTATLPHVSTPVKAMIELQQLTGMRPGEVVIMRACDIEQTGDVWIFTPEKHKTQNHGHARIIPLGPKAQAIITPFITATDSTAYLFSPADAEARRREAVSDARTTPDNQGNGIGSNRKRKPKRAAGERYHVASYRRAIERGADLAFPPPEELARHRMPGEKGDGNTRRATIAEWKERLGDRWAELEAHRAKYRWHPHQLRHGAATKLRAEHGLEAAQVILGHKTLKVTQIYAERNVKAALAIMAQAG